MSSLYAAAVQIKIERFRNEIQHARDLDEKLSLLADQIAWLNGMVAAGDLSEAELSVATLAFRTESARDKAKSARSPEDACNALADEVVWVSGTLLWAIQFGAMQTKQAKELKAELASLRAK